MTLLSLIQLLLIGIAIAAIVLGVAWYKNRSFSFHRLVLLTTFFTFDLILFGAFTRLTDSGLGCPDWPGCYGLSNPIAAINHIQEAEQLMPTGPVTLSKAWIEMLHRYFAMGVGCLIIGMVFWSYRLRSSMGSMYLRASIAILGLVCVQGAFGAWTVTQKLQPIIVTTHLLLGLSLLSALTIFSNVTSLTAEVKFESRIRNQFRLWLVIGLVILIAQIFLGAWVSTNYAVLACDDFPTCQGGYWPAMDLTKGFHLWRDLGHDHVGELLTMDALRAIHWVHRLGAVVTLIVLFIVSFKVASETMLRRWGLALISLCLLQLFTGMSNIVLDWPLIAALLHTGGAAGMLVVIINLLTTLQRTRRHV